jgi:DNA-binding Lrp family transcriptional regulator
MTESLKLDRLDLRILAQLQKNGRITNVDLADAVGLSPSPCLIRVKRLEQAGYIAGYGTYVRLEKLGDTLTVFTEVTLTDHHREDFIRFEASIRDVDEIMECHLVSGGYDYLLRFLTRGVNHYQAVIEGLLERNIGIEKYFSYIVIKSPFIKTHCPIERLFPERRTVMLVVDRFQEDGSASARSATAQNQRTPCGSASSLKS